MTETHYGGTYMFVGSRDIFNNNYALDFDLPLNFFRDIAPYSVSLPSQIVIQLAS